MARTTLGAVAGFVLGAAAGLLLYYLLVMAPAGQPFRVIDQGVLVIWLTGPAGAVVGGLIGHASQRARGGAGRPLR